MPGSSNNPRGHPTTVTGNETHPANSKKFLKEFFSPEYGGKPKSCKSKGVQCGLPGLARGDDWPTVDPSSAPSGEPSGDGGGDGGGGGGGVGASVAVSKEKGKMGTRFRREMPFGQGRTAAPPKELGSNPEELRKRFTQQEEMEPPVVVNAEDVEVVDEPSRASRAEGEDMGGEMGGDMGGEGMAVADGDAPDGAVEVNEEDVDDVSDEDDDGESRVEEGSMNFRSGEDDPSMVYALSEEEAAEVVELPDMEGGMEDEPSDDDLPGGEHGCQCPSGHGVPGDDVPEVGMDEVEMLDDGDADDLGGEGRVHEESYEVGCGQQTMAGADADEDDEPSSPSKSPEEEAPEEPSEKNAAAEDLVEVLTPIESLAEVDIADVELNLFNEDSENPHYTVMVKGEPVAKIALADQTLAPEHADMFLQDEYPQSVLEGIESFGLRDTLASVKARYYASHAFSGAVAERMKAAAAEEMADEAKRSVAQVKDTLSSVASLVIEASMKNYIVENPLRDALVQNVRRAGVDPEAAVDLVEDAFRKAGPEYFSTVLSKAEEWMGAPKEAMDHHVKEITGMPYRHPGYVQEADDDSIQDAVIPEEAPSYMTASVKPSVPVRTIAAPTPSPRTAAAQPNLTGDWQADKDLWKQRLNLFGRTASKSLSLRNNKR